MRKASIGQRGKFAEGEVRKLLERQSNAHAAFDYNRIYDARSAGGRFPGQPGDFGFYRTEAHGLIEAKEIGHDHRLPKDKLAQLPKLHKRQLAGGTIIVLVFHTATELWRMVPFKWLWDRRTQPSWDLSEFPTYVDLDSIPGLVPALVGFKGFAKK